MFVYMTFLLSVCLHQISALSLFICSVSNEGLGYDMINLVFVMVFLIGPGKRLDKSKSSSEKGKEELS